MDTTSSTPIERPLPILTGSTINPVEYFVLTDVTSMGDVVAVLREAEAIVHLAAIPNPLGHLPDKVFATNMLSDFNVLEAADLLGISNIAKASSINAMGTAFNRSLVPPRYFPVDEEHETRCEEVYSITKWLGEELSAAYARGRNMQIASLRFTWVMDQKLRAQVEAKRDAKAEAERKAKAFWTWIDVRDVATSCRLAVEKDWKGHETFWINAADTYLDLPTADALAKWYPDVPLRQPIEGNASAVSIEKAERILGWRPVHSWRNRNLSG